MTANDFAAKYLQPYKVKGDELVPDLCPFCHGGQGRDKHTFALNRANLTYNCRRGGCAVRGHFVALCRHFGEVAEGDGLERQRPAVKAYKRPEQAPASMTDGALQYLQTRGLSAATLEAYRIGVDANGNLLFPFYDEKGEHVFNKFRPAHKVAQGERKAWREAGTKPILFGMHLCDPQDPLCITEGEIDAMSCHEAGIANAVSVPSGAEDVTWLDTCWDFLQKFECIYLFGDNDDPGREMVRRLQAKLSDHRVFVVEHAEKDANLLMYKQSKGAVLDAYMRARETPVNGLVNLADVAPLDITNTPKVLTGIRELNRMLGGFMMGDVTVWTGKRAEGKSTVLSQLMLDAIEDGKRVCAYSGELRADRYQYWADLQAAGRENLVAHKNTQEDRTVYYVNRGVRDLIHGWYSRRYWLYDNTAVLTDEESGVIQVFEKAARRYDCNVFLIDNLMTVDYGAVPERDFYLQQTRFINQLAAFANLYNVHVHLVAHPRKTNGITDSDEVSGSGNVTNRAANVIAVARTEAGSGADLMLNVLKNRWEGKTGIVQLLYDDASHRVYEPGTGQNKKYGWAVQEGFTYVNEPWPEEV